MSEVEEAAAGRARASSRVLAIATLILLAAVFSFLNANERIAIDLGFTTLYRLSLVGVVFSVFLLGMLTMFLFSLHYDRAVREALRSHAFRQSFPARPLSPLPSSAPPVVHEEGPSTAYTPSVHAPDLHPEPLSHGAVPEGSPTPEPEPPA